MHWKQHYVMSRHWFENVSIPVYVKRKTNYFVVFYLSWNMCRETRIRLRKRIPLNYVYFYGCISCKTILNISFFIIDDVAGKWYQNNCQLLGGFVCKIKAGRKGYLFLKFKPGSMSMTRTALALALNKIMSLVWYIAWWWSIILGLIKKTVTRLKFSFE